MDPPGPPLHKGLSVPCVSFHAVRSMSSLVLVYVFCTDIRSEDMQAWYRIKKSFPFFQQCIHFYSRDLILGVSGWLWFRRLGLTGLALLATKVHTEPDVAALLHERASCRQVLNWGLIRDLRVVLSLSQGWVQQGEVENPLQILSTVGVASWLSAVEVKASALWRACSPRLPTGPWRRRISLWGKFRYRNVLRL